MVFRAALGALMLVSAGPAIAQEIDDDPPQRTPRAAHRFLDDAFENVRVRQFWGSGETATHRNVDRVYSYRPEHRCKSVIGRGTNGDLELDWSSLESVTADGGLLQIEIDGLGGKVEFDMRSDSFANRAVTAIQFLHDHCRETGF